MEYVISVTHVQSETVKMKMNFILYNETIRHGITCTPEIET